MQEFTYKEMDDGSYCVMTYEGDEAEVKIPDTAGENGCITVLNDDLFKGHEEITSVTIPETVTDIGEFVFFGCKNLKQLQLPAGLQTLWGCTFTNCGLEEIILPDGIKSIPSYCFMDCADLKRVVCGKGLTNVRAWAFGGCDALKELNTGTNNVRISPLAFEKRPIDR
ncbi:MAG: leucine-rich repeat domain-containing protein [Lachnospiraceae bacterium]|nr:leucine-rich repeat domain-containing protein [Lachnospiraceae bacterium]